MQNDLIGLYNVPQVSQTLQTLEELYIVNNITFLHGLSTYVFEDAVGLQYINSIPVVHSTMYIDMGTYIHANPAPVFIPASPSVTLIVLGCILLCRRHRSRL